MSEVSVREATLDDTEAFVDTMWSVAEEGRWIATEVPFDREDKRAGFRSVVEADDSAAWVAEVDGRVVAHLGLHRTRYGTFELGMAIRDGHRSRGVGTALMNAALAWARTTDAHKIELQVWPDNDAALALYEKFGFEREGYLRQQYRRRDGSLRDAVVMGLLLVHA